ncbi:MAG: hypothetical protein C4576_12840 [Desulfobacteraceae bacterium]|nr:MAG: hypothetical protein C4576_12840 [Desulfobacteraceae bacterium]
MKSYKAFSAFLHQRMLFLLIGFLVINIVIFFRVREEGTARIARLHETYEAKRKASVSQRSDDPHLEMEQTGKDLLRFTGFLPGRLMIPDLMQELLELLDQNGLPRVNMSFTPESANFPNIMRYTTGFTVNGEYPQLKTFLAGLQNSKSLFCIEGLSLTSQKGDGGPVTLQLKLALYLQSGPEKEGKG